MTLSELCIRRPVMTVLLSVAIVIAGAVAYFKIPVAALPSFNTPIISVSATLPGASPENMASSVALPLEKEFSTIDGIQVISSSNFLGVTNITLEFNNNRDIDKAAVDVQAALLRAQKRLPIEMTVPPSYRKINPAETPVIVVRMSSPSVNLAELNDYAENLLSPTISTITGVAQVLVYGAKRYAIRVRARPDALASRNLTLDDIAIAINKSNSNSPVGVLDGPRQGITIYANPQMIKPEEFANLVIAQRNGLPVYLKDVADVSQSYEDVKTWATANGERSIAIAVLRQPNANTVEVVDAVKKLLPQFQKQMPASIQLQLLNDRSLSIKDSIHDVNITLALTILLVVLVIFLFLKHLSATIIPSISMPISLIGAFFLLYILGYSLDNISLLGITLAVGLVVDDAIVVLENIMRYVEQGMDPLKAALIGSKEVGFTIISISLSLVAVFIPMLCSRFLPKPGNHPQENALMRQFDKMFEWTLKTYLHYLDLALSHRKTVLWGAISTFVITILLFMYSPTGFFPEEDISQITATTEAAEDISFTAMLALQDQAAEIVRKNPNVESSISIIGGGLSTGTNTGRFLIILKPKGDRLPMAQVLEGLRTQFKQLPGLNIYMRPVQNLQLGGRNSKSRYQFTLQSVGFEGVNIWAEKMLEKMRSNPMFRDVTSDSQLKGLNVQIEIDREKAASAGVNIADIRTALYSAFGERQVSTIYSSVNTYYVILEAAPEDRQFETDLNKIFVRGRATDKLIPLSSLASFKRTIGPTAVNHQGQIPAVTISFNLAPDVFLGDATDQIEKYVKAIELPPSIITSYGGDAAVFKNNQSGQIILILAALGVIYVLLGVLYESYIHPLTILAGLPSAAIGALLALRLFGFELTVIASIGILLLIGIVKKNAILLIDFALEAQRQSYPYMLGLNQTKYRQINYSLQPHQNDRDSSQIAP